MTNWNLDSPDSASSKHHNREYEIHIDGSDLTVDVTVFGNSMSGEQYSTSTCQIPLEILTALLESQGYEVTSRMTGDHPDTGTGDYRGES